MDLGKGDVVRSLAGHDKGELYCVVDAQGDFLLLVNGKGRRMDNPKRKRRKHVQRAGTWDHPVLQRLRRGEAVGEREVRNTLATFRCEQNQQQARRE